jgi:trigger factor
MVEKMYGAGVLYEDAINEALDATYGNAVDESELEVVSRPEIGIEQVEKGKNLIYTATVAVKPEVTLGDYKGIEVTKAVAEVTDEDIEAELKKVQEQNSRLVTVEDRAVEDGDQTVIDFEGFVDGKSFEGGKGEDYPLTIGSHSFIDTFEEQLIGKNIGEECDIKVTFPNEYHATDLAGKEALFKVTVKEIKKKELPELNDEFAEEVSEFETLEEYKKDIREKAAENKAKAAATENENNVVEKVAENATMDIPEPMIDGQVSNMMNDYARRMQSQGLSLDQYMKFTGMTIETLKEQMKPQALKRIQTRLVLEAIVKAENITVGDEAVEKEIANMAENYKMEASQVKEYLGEAGIAQMKEDLAVQEAVDFLVAEAKLV